MGMNDGDVEQLRSVPAQDNSPYAGERDGRGGPRVEVFKDGSWIELMY
jgi:hypothetical protein